MLAVAIERHGPFKTLLPRVRQAGFERSAFALVALVLDHDRAGNFGEARSFVRRTVVHDQHERELPAQSRDQSRDAGSFIETRNHGGTVGWFRHTESLK